LRPLSGFDLIRPRTLVGALEALATLEEAVPIAGGTDLIALYRDVGGKASHLVDLSQIPELGGIVEEGNNVIIGPTTTHAQLLASEVVAKRVPALHDAVKVIGSVQVRNMATVGGNLCNASPAADTAPPLLVHGAEAQVSSLEDTRWVPLVDFFKGPKMTILEPDELLTGLRVQVTAGCSSFQRLGRRRGFTLSVVNSATYLERYGDKVREARIAFGSVAPTPIRVPKAEVELKGKALTESLIEKVAKECTGLVSPINDVRGTAEYRRDMTAVLARRALREAWTRSGGVLK